MPPAVGLQMPNAQTGLHLMLGMHYFNSGAPIEDASGAEICVARKPRPNTAGVHIVGAEGFRLPARQTTEVKATCTPAHQGDIHIVRTLPHMHKSGVHLDTKISRADGSTSELIDMPFDFNNQLSYPADSVLHPGDHLLTTCRFQIDGVRAVVDGESSSDEMCVNFITAWPAGSLNNARLKNGGAGCS